MPVKNRMSSNKTKRAGCNIGLMPKERAIKNAAKGNNLAPYLVAKFI